MQRERHGERPSAAGFSTMTAVVESDAAGRGRGLTRIGAANADRILDAALSAFARDGLNGARIEAIAAAAGLSKTNLLYYFRSKEALYEAVLVRTLDRWLEPLRDLDATAEPETALTAYITQKLVFSRDMPEASRLFANEIMRGAPVLSRVLATDLADLVADKTRVLAGWMEEGRLRTLDPWHLVFAIWATTQHYADFAAQIAALTGRDLTDPAFFETTRATLVSILLRGALPSGEVITSRSPPPAG